MHGDLSPTSGADHPTESLSERLEALARSLEREFAVYRRVLRHPATPLASKLLLGAAVGYALMPFDLIPDVIPVLGQLDDLVIVPLLVLAALGLVPEEVLSECREQSPTTGSDPR